MKRLSLACVSVILPVIPLLSQPYQANAIKVGEVSYSEAVIWTRLTSVESADPASQRAAAPGLGGQVRLTWWPEGSPEQKVESAWHSVRPESDFTHLLKLTQLKPNTRYRIQSDSRSLGGPVITSSVSGQLKTAPHRNDTTTPVLATLVTCQGIGTVDDPVLGHAVYADMRALNPDFFVHTGDIVYYDKDYTGRQARSSGLTQELSTNGEKARQRWNRMFAFQYNRDFSANVASYFMKDDHDTTFNDCWPGRNYFDLTFEEGLAIFSEQTPSGPLPYRTRRWGQDLQIWLLEGRDYRSPNNMKDGPDKTILGEIQKSWLQETLKSSDATFKLVISPTPIVGSDKANKSDNHSNEGFKTEGDALRKFLSGIDNCFVVNGDRHWQYISTDPVTGLREYGTGPINAEHNYGGAIRFNERYHHYLALKGGYLSIRVKRVDGVPRITFQYHDIDALDPQTGRSKIVYQETVTAEGFGL